MGGWVGWGVGRMGRRCVAAARPGSSSGCRCSAARTAVVHRHSGGLHGALQHNTHLAPQYHPPPTPPPPAPRPLQTKLMRSWALVCDVYFLEPQVGGVNTSTHKLEGGVGGWVVVVCCPAVCRRLCVDCCVSSSASWGHRRVWVCAWQCMYALSGWVAAAMAWSCSYRRGTWVAAAVSWQLARPAAPTTFTPPWPAILGFGFVVKSLSSTRFRAPLRCCSADPEAGRVFAAVCGAGAAHDRRWVGPGGWGQVDKGAPQKPAWWWWGGAARLGAAHDWGWAGSSGWASSAARLQWRLLRQTRCSQLLLQYLPRGGWGHVCQEEHPPARRAFTCLLTPHAAPSASMSALLSQGPAAFGACYPPAPPPPPTFFALFRCGADKARLRVAPWDGYLKYYNLGEKVR